MAVENKYVNADIAADKKALAALNGGAKTMRQLFNFEVAVADDDGSIYRIGKNIPGDCIVTKIELFNDAIAGATSYDIGLYETLEDGVGGAVIDKDIFLAAEDINAGNTRASSVNGLSAVAIEDLDKDIAALAGHDFDTRKLGYDIAVTANTVGAAAGTVCGIIEYVQG